MSQRKSKSKSKGSKMAAGDIPDEVLERLDEIIELLREILNKYMRRDV